jgi:hypothetical protein
MLTGNAAYILTPNVAQQQATIAWTDSGGLHWRRTGSNLPDRLAEPWTWDNRDPQVAQTQ